MRASPRTEAASQHPVPPCFWVSGDSVISVVTCSHISTLSVLPLRFILNPSQGLKQENPSKVLEGLAQRRNLRFFTTMRVNLGPKAPIIFKQSAYSLTHLFLKEGKVFPRLSSPVLQGRRNAEKGRAGRPGGSEGRIPKRP